MEQTPRKTKEMSITDPFGNRIHFSRISCDVTGEEIAVLHVVGTGASILASRTSTHLPLSFLRMDSVWPARVID